MSAAMLLPALADIRRGNDDWQVFIFVSLLTCMVATLVVVATNGATARFSTRLGFLLTASLWVTACFLGALPLFFSHLSMSFAQAIFEAVSGVTTTGATVLSHLDDKPAGILLWRSLLCWIGGIGFIALALLLLPSLRVGGVQLFHMESSDRTEKILPRMNQIANAIIIAYLSLTIICTLCYFAAGMNMFDALNYSMATVATAGFSTHDGSLGFYKDQPMIIVIAIIFMLASAIPFVFYVKMVTGHKKQRFYDPQIRLFLLIVFVASVVLALALHLIRDEPLLASFLTALFHVVSVITTTGYTIENYAQWGALALGIFFLASLIGGCSGSTSGGIKINRVIILWRLTSANLARLLSPNVVVKVRYGSSEVSGDIAQTVLLFLCLYMMTLVVGAMFLIVSGLDFVSAVTGALTALSNVGPGFGDKIGPVGNFSMINDRSLWIFSFLMLAGRLEIVTMFILFIPAFWQR